MEGGGGMGEEVALIAEGGRGVGASFVDLIARGGWGGTLLF